MIIRSCQWWSRTLTEVACVPACLCGCCHGRAVSPHHQMCGHTRLILRTVKMNMISGLHLRTLYRDGSGLRNQLGKITCSGVRWNARTSRMALRRLWLCSPQAQSASNQPRVEDLSSSPRLPTISGSNLRFALWSLATRDHRTVSQRASHETQLSRV